MSRNHQSFYERLDRDLARLDRLKSSDRGVLESLLFYLLGYIEGFHEAGAISGNECGRLIQRARAAAVVSAKPEVSAHDQPEPVPAIAPEGLRLPELLCPQSPGQDVRLSPSPARRQLRLLCLLVTPKLGTAQAACLPIHTLHRLPPRQWSVVNGRIHVTLAYTCAKHTPPSRPPKFWSVVYDSGKPTPFVPLREPFELVG